MTEDAFFLTNLAFADLIQTQVRDNSIEPSAEAAIEPEFGQISINAQEGFLVDVARVLLRMEEIEGHPQHVGIVGPDQALKSLRITSLSGANQGVLVGSSE